MRNLTKTVFLGTGNPNPDPRRRGCSLLIISGGKTYLVDFGEGLIRQFSALTKEYGGPHEGLDPGRIEASFLTHLHADHTLGYPDLIFTPWIMGRDKPLEVYGPKGIREMTENILRAYKEDINYRISGPEPANDTGWKVNAHEIEPGVIYEDENIMVSAFSVSHGNMPNAYGFRFSCHDKTVVVSGDTAPCPGIIENARGADILVHEVYSARKFEEKDQAWKKYHSEHHTSTDELAEIARRTEPGLLVLYHVLFWGSTEEEILREISDNYSGKVAIAKDLQVFEET